MPRSKDVLIRALAAEGQVRAFAVNATRLCERARTTQQSWPAATAALGRLLSAAVMMAVTIKEGERISLRVEGDGPLDMLFAQAYPDGRARGYLRYPEINPPSTQDGKLDVGRAVGRHGEFYVIRDLDMAEPYVGRVPLQSGEIGDDLAYYFATSEQQPTAVGLGVLVGADHRVVAAGGYIVQPLTGASEAVLQQLEENLANAPAPSALVLQQRDPAGMLDILLAGMNWHETDRVTPRFFCGCSRVKSRHALLAFSLKELRQMRDETEPVVVTCEFCRRAYQFQRQDLERVLTMKARDTHK